MWKLGLTDAVDCSGVKSFQPPPPRADTAAVKGAASALSFDRAFASPSIIYLSYLSLPEFVPPPLPTCHTWRGGGGNSRDGRLWCLSANVTPTPANAEISLLRQTSVTPCTQLRPFPLASLFISLLPPRAPAATPRRSPLKTPLPSPLLESYEPLDAVTCSREVKWPIKVASAVELGGRCCGTGGLLKHGW